MSNNSTVLFALWNSLHYKRVRESVSFARHHHSLAVCSWNHTIDSCNQEKN